VCLPLTVLVLLPIPVLLVTAAVLELAAMGLPGLVLGVGVSAVTWVALRRLGRAAVAWWRRAGQPSRG